MQQFKKQHHIKTDFEAVGESAIVSQTPLVRPVGFELCSSRCPGSDSVPARLAQVRSPSSTVQHMAAAGAVLALPLEWAAAPSGWRVGAGSGEVLEAVGAAG